MEMIALVCSPVWWLTLLMLSMNNKNHPSLSSQDTAKKAVPIVIVFGRPGSGKTTVANAALTRLKQQQCSVIGLDLDVCVPQWMRDNFAKGMYPNLDQRLDFAQSAADHVESSLLHKQKSSLLAGAIVSFSFVNVDLRDVFRRRFPNAVWYLMETTEEEAAQRILSRHGHFYKGKVVSSGQKQQQQQEEEESSDRPASDNQDWNFAPVTFDHVILDGTRSVDENAEIVARGLVKLNKQQRKNVS